MRNRFAGLLFCLILTFLGNSNSMADSEAQWSEEMLLQLSELRKAQGELAKQVSDLRRQLQALQPDADAERQRLISMDLSDGAVPLLGKRDAPIAIVEFSDFECPFCLRHHRNTAPAIKAKYIDSGKVQYAFVDYPLPFHAQAAPAAVTAACAHKQGEFWDMHAMLFENQSNLQESSFAQFVQKLGLDGEAFRKCVDDPRTRAQIDSDVQFAQSIGVQGTPAFLIGRVIDGKLIDGRLISGAQPLAAFEQVVDRLLAPSR